MSLSMPRVFERDCEKRLDQIYEELQKKGRRKTAEERKLTAPDVWHRAEQEVIGEYIGSGRLEEAAEALVYFDGFLAWAPGPRYPGTHTLLSALSEALLAKRRRGQAKRLWRAILAKRRGVVVDLLLHAAKKEVQSQPKARRHAEKDAKYAEEYLDRTVHDYSDLLKRLDDPREKRWLQAWLAAPSPEPKRWKFKADARPVDERHFWQIIEGRRKEAKEWGAGKEYLKARLAVLESTGIVSFQKVLYQRLAEAYRQDLWAVAWIAKGGCSDDSFLYFRAWLVAQGRRRYRAALEDPRNALQGVKPGADLECEELLYIAPAVYEGKTGKSIDDELAPPEEHLRGDPWDEADLDRVYADLCERFGFVPPAATARPKRAAPGRRAVPASVKPTKKG